MAKATRLWATTATREKTDLKSSSSPSWSLSCSSSVAEKAFSSNIGMTNMYLWSQLECLKEYLYINMYSLNNALYNNG